ncbi:hypothetical protein N0V93_004664 [Gnomoniopsis smithogilvyi]|uniref:Flavin reductase like domain-containing protein n=1 Tax=Gnomoniopsis smithogilvyi TaxID=1191159 RepID=A0A9W8YT20_9PEZI|nr:hypothetical protein N0V93_004664 [Gnomoniopsis smithogilvyi]
MSYLRTPTTGVLSALRRNPPTTPFFIRSTTANRATFTTHSALRMKESDIKRNPHPDFKGVEASRPPFNRDAAFNFTQTPQPDWKPGSGANDLPTGDAKHITIDPNAEGRSPVNNYKLLISAVVPRPIAFVSTRSKDGKTTNLAPFSYFQLINHDPPLFIIGFASSLENSEKQKHSLYNLNETGECTINIISEHFLEAANSTSINAPYGTSEWTISGLTPGYDCETVKCARVKEAVFSIEGKVESLREFESRSRPGKMSGTMAVVEGTRFWAREDAVNEDRNLIDPAVLKPVSRLGGITYGRTVDGIELLRPDFDKDLGGMEGYQKLEAEKGGAADKATHDAQQKI